MTKVECAVCEEKFDEKDLEQGVCPDCIEASNVKEAAKKCKDCGKSMKDCECKDCDMKVERILQGEDVAATVFEEKDKKDKYSKLALQMSKEIRKHMRATKAKLLTPEALKPGIENALKSSDMYSNKNVDKIMQHLADANKEDPNVYRSLHDGWYAEDLADFLRTL